MTINLLSVAFQYPDRAFACEEALAEPFYGIARIYPDHAWTGEESALWPLRRLARTAGWHIKEIDETLGKLALTVRYALDPGRSE